ncbi:substrate-binding domain-containing protein [Gimibacter soli]|uniref:Substrate-binding domain-containing protein n=1 Tax=Gimibacter soli TaxID=3024400 RepID=A0AAE9XU44_9PROT|nr:substrate-binding domain-containing protein [Gimibacter soli]WCL52719.1 substrate-binding domain-containing protein [Gimibacter soli]
MPAVKAEARLELDGLRVQTFQSDNPEQAERTVRFEGPEAASKPWRICAVLPNVSDSYWDWVVDGLRQEAAALGVRVAVFEASGYDASGLEQQRRLLMSRCVGGKYDAILIAAIEDGGLNEPLAAARTAGIPVIDLINGYDDTKVSAHAMVDFWHLGSLAAKMTRDMAAKGAVGAKGKARVLWVPGPEMANWVQCGHKGFTETLADVPGIEVISLYGPPFERVQAQLIRDAWDKHGPFDMVVGTAPTAAAAVSLRASGMLPHGMPVLSYYATPTVMDLFARGKLMAVGTDEPVVQARIGVSLAVMLLEGMPVPRVVGPIPRMVHHSD